MKLTAGHGFKPVGKGPAGGITQVLIAAPKIFAVLVSPVGDFQKWPCAETKAASQYPADGGMVCVSVSR